MIAPWYYKSYGTLKRQNALTHFTQCSTYGETKQMVSTNKMCENETMKQ